MPMAVEIGRDGLDRGSGVRLGSLAFAGVVKQQRHEQERVVAGVAGEIGEEAGRLRAKMEDVLDRDEGVFVDGVLVVIVSDDQAFDVGPSWGEGGRALRSYGERGECWGPSA